MDQFNPTKQPTERLCRIGVIVDATQPGRDQVARFCDLAGLGSVWLTDRLGALGSEWSHGIWVDAAVVGAALSGASLGVMTSSAPHSEAFASTSVELSLTDADAVPQERVARRQSVVVSELEDIGRVLPFVDDVAFNAWDFPDLETAADEARATAQENGRDPTTLGVAAILPVSIGRTKGEASARADRDPVFSQLGHPREIGIFGTLEECQDRVIALAHAGVTDLRVILPSAPDVHDVIAQLTAMTIGTTDQLVPGSLRSAAPPPPEGWGGRPDVPPGPRVSGGSRRR